ncbi:beta-1,4-N-acetylgalactosaminyltransferase bre-4-like isoform X2 [Mytilus galloprovincialis]|uniref:beta-1,4-N-acetylgalactosaminyltransferase bre-4-like isoform X2 n=1 Tax=Mytilus galloprovincialis TaxID=29158 RepID=UPI003F7BB2D7
MTTSLLEHGLNGLNAKQILRLLFRKFRDLCNLRCISIIGLAFLIVQFLLLILYGHTRCEGEICVTESRNTSSFYSIFFWNWRKKGPLLPLCPTIPPGLYGYIKPSTEVLTWAELESKFLNLHYGGRYKPPNCTSRHRVAIIVPFRDREIHLKIFLNNLHPILQRQQIEYGIYVVDLDLKVQFNRALLLNVGVLESLRLHDYQCFIFHDVDLLPENDNNLYTCPDNPRHMSVAVNRLKYKLPYDKIFGGVAAISKEDFLKVNGYSNRYFGWGGEDDDMFNRINAMNLTITRYHPGIARYIMLPHAKQEENLARFDILKSGKVTFMRDGINTLKYDRLILDFRRLLTYIMVTVNQTEIASVSTREEASDTT